MVECMTGKERTGLIELKASRQGCCAHEIVGAGSDSLCLYVCVPFPGERQLLRDCILRAWRQPPLCMNSAG